MNQEPKTHDAEAVAAAAHFAAAALSYIRKKALPTKVAATAKYVAARAAANAGVDPETVKKALGDVADVRAALSDDRRTQIMDFLVHCAVPVASGKINFFQIPGDDYFSLPQTRNKVRLVVDAFGIDENAFLKSKKREAAAARELFFFVAVEIDGRYAHSVSRYLNMHVNSFKCAARNKLFAYGADVEADARKAFSVDNPDPEEIKKVAQKIVARKAVAAAEKKLAKKKSAYAPA